MGFIYELPTQLLSQTPSFKNNLCADMKNILVFRLFVTTHSNFSVNLEFPIFPMVVFLLYIYLNDVLLCLLFLVQTWIFKWIWWVAYFFTYHFPPIYVNQGWHFFEVFRRRRKLCSDNTFEAFFIFY